jgi:hypothetical protein
VLGKSIISKIKKIFALLGRRQKSIKQYLKKSLINYFQLHLQFEKLMKKQSLDYIF